MAAVKLGNSFLDSPAMGQKVLVIVPHEDDEINVAGSVMYSYVQKGADVYCAFTTNGDYSFWARTRMHEAWRSLQTLGVQHVVFLGYGDTSNHYPGGHWFYSPEKAVTAPSGHHETYGCDDFPDYAFAKRGIHRPYCRKSMKTDLKDLIEDIQADIIFAVDNDVHADHRATSLLFEEALGELLCRPGNTYHPMVFKGFAYCTSFGAPKDFYADNIKSVSKPPVCEDNLIDISLYEWNRRVRFPVFPACRGFYLRRNVLYQALFQHASQSAALHAVRIANGDAVFWQRRTDNLAFQAIIMASSGKVERLRDFKLLDVDQIDDKKMVFADYLWQPDDSDPDKIVSYRWQQPQKIICLRLAGNIESTGRIEKLAFTFDDGTYMILGPLPGCGHIAQYILPEPHIVTSCSLQILKVNGSGWGLSEVGFFASLETRGVITPFIKIMIDDDFAYDYRLPARVKTCQLKIYRYQVTAPVVYTVVKGNGGEVGRNGLVRFSSNSRQLVIRASLKGNPEIYDEIHLYRESSMILAKRSIVQWLENKMLTFYLKKYRKYTHIRYKYLKQL